MYVLTIVGLFGPPAVIGALWRWLIGNDTGMGFSTNPVGDVVFGIMFLIGYLWFFLKITRAAETAINRRWPGAI